MAPDTLHWSSIHPQRCEGTPSRESSMRPGHNAISIHGPLKQGGIETEGADLALRPPEKILTCPSLNIQLPALAQSLISPWSPSIIRTLQEICSSCWDDVSFSRLIMTCVVIWQWYFECTLHLLPVIDRGHRAFLIINFPPCEMKSVILRQINLLCFTISLPKFHRFNLEIEVFTIIFHLLSPFSEALPHPLTKCQLLPPTGTSSRRNNAGSDDAAPNWTPVALNWGLNWATGSNRWPPIYRDYYVLKVPPSPNLPKSRTHWHFIIVLPLFWLNSLQGFVSLGFYRRGCVAQEKTYFR